MRSVIKAGMLVLTLSVMPIAAHAGTLEGVAIGAGSGAIVAGPVGAVVGGVVGAVVGGPNLRPRHYARGQRHCWRDRQGLRHCKWR